MFKNTPTYRRDGEVYFGLRRPVVIRDSSDSIYEVKQSDNGSLEDISYKMYGTPKLWWVIAEVNHVMDVHTKVTPGLRIRIPSKSRLQTLNIPID